MEQIWNKYQSKIPAEKPNKYLDYLTDLSFQEVNRTFVLSFENYAHRKIHTGHFLQKVDIKDYNVMIDRENFFDQPLKSNLRTYDNIQKIATAQGDDYKAGCLLDYPYI